MSLDYLSQRDLAAVSHTIAVLEQTHGVIPKNLLPALAHPDLRLIVDAQLDAVGRTVIEHRTADGVTDGYSSGYADDVADRLAEQGLGILIPADRATVALVLLWCIAMPTVQGRAPLRWTNARPVKLERLHHNRPMKKNQVSEAVNRLHDAHVLVNGRAVGVRPGPAFDRLTPTQQRYIEEDLFILAAPDDPVAAALLRRRNNTEM